MTQLFAQPYDISAAGFFFESIKEYDSKSGKLRNSYGEPVEEFEIQFIDGEDIDAQLFKALGIHQGNFHQFLDAVDAWEKDDKITVIIAVGEVGYNFDFDKDDPQDFEIDLYELDGLYDLALYFVEAGVYGDIPNHLYNDFAHLIRLDDLLSQQGDLFDF